MAKVKKPIEADTNYVYIGPNKLTEGLKLYTIYRGDISGIVSAFAEKYPGIARLFVKVDDLGKAMQEVNKKGTPLYVAYHNVKGAE